MNFDYLKSFPDMKKLYDYCSEAEEFALYKPNISATSARKAMEFIVKMIYASLVGQDYGFTVFEMITDERFTDYVNDPTLVNTIHYIRKMGNDAVHEGELSKAESLKILEELHFLVGEFCILLGLVNDYPEYKKPGTEAPSPAPSKAEEKKATEEPKKVTVEPELIAKFAPRMRQVKFDVKFKRDKEENKKLYMADCLREAGWPIMNQQDQAKQMKKMIIAVLALCLIFGAAISVKAMNKPEQVQPEPQTEAVVSGEEAAAVQPVTEGESAEEAPAQEPVQVKTLDYEAIYALHDPEETVMVMDGRDVKWKEYFAWVYNGCAQVENYMNTYAMYGMAMNWDDPMSDDPTDTFAKYATDSAESMLTQMQTIESFCAANGVELSEKSKEEIAKNLEEQIKSYCGEGATEEEFFNLLKLSYMDKDSYKRMNSINYYYQDGMNALYGQDGADVTDEDAQAYLDESGYMNANHILFLTKDMNTGEALDEAAIAEKKAQADGIYEELITIKDPDKLVARFKELKEKYDEDTGKTTNPDGYIFLPGQMVPEFENGTLALEDYGVSEPVESTYGYHVILRLPLTVDSVLTTSEEGTPLTARSLCANKLYGEALEAYMGQMKIEYADGFEVPDLTKFIKG